MMWILIPCGLLACVALGTDPEKKREQEAKKRRGEMGHRGVSRVVGSYAWEGKPSYRRAMPLTGVTARPRSYSCPERALPYRHPLDSGILPWLSERVDDAIVHQINHGHRDCDVIATMVLREVYPVTTDGTPIQWPCVPRDAAALGCLEQRVKIRVQRHLAEVSDLEADHDYPDDHGLED